MPNDTTTTGARSYLGCDPGVKGALVLLDAAGGYIDGLSRHEGSETVICQWLRERRGVIAFAAIEKVGAMKMDGRASMFTFGEQAGGLRFALVALEIPFTLVSPQSWQASGRIIVPSKLAADCTGLDDAEAARARSRAANRAKLEHKAAIIEQARRRWPGIPIKSKSEDGGLADAAYLALHARAVHLGLPIALPARKGRASAAECAR